MLHAIPARALVMLGVVLVTAGIGACARSAAQIRWDSDFLAASRTGDIAALDTLATRAIRARDNGEALLEAAAILRDRGDDSGAARRYQHAGHHAPRRVDRARARYELARLAEARGRIAAATELYRAIVTTYPELMPGERALSHLLRLARAEGDAAVLAHLAWTRRIYPRLRETSLGDNLVFQAAEVFEERFKSKGLRADQDLAMTLYRRILRDHPRGELRDDAWWQLSWIHHQRGEYDAEIAAIEAIQRGREEVSFFGQNEHPYFYVGQRRLARLHLVVRKDPRAARDAWRTYADIWTRSIYRDDAWFYAGCAALQIGDVDGARADFAAIAEHRPESRFLRRIEAALADPHGSHCLPPEEKP
jgi:tetratricopeptide (TPR) repeat protein